MESRRRYCSGLAVVSLNSLLPVELPKAVIDVVKLSLWNVTPVVRRGGSNWNFAPADSKTE